MYKTLRYNLTRKFVLVWLLLYPYNIIMELENNSDLKKVQITIVLDDERESFEMDANKTILEAALDKDIDVPFSCQGGICTSCMAKVTEGKAIMESNSVLTDGEVEDGIVLTCQAHPTTPTIVVNYDEV